MYNYNQITSDLVIMCNGFVTLNSLELASFMMFDIVFSIVPSTME